MADSLTLKRGDKLISEGMEDSELYLVQEGELKVYKKIDGKNEAIGVIKTGDIVGEMSFLDKQPRFATVIATSHCTIIKITREQFEDYIENQPNWFKALLTALVSRIRDVSPEILRKNIKSVV